MIVNVPDSLRGLEPQLAEFFDGMVFKLHVNSHKKGLEQEDIPGFISLMKEELVEFEEQMLKDATDVNVLMETFDASNFWFLIYAYLRQEGVATQRERFLEEYFDIQCDLGRVFCVKKRSGSKYGPGDEITGTKNAKGEVMVRTQTAEGGFAVTLPRSHLIWWKATGKWPTRLERRHGPADSDIFSNLYEPEEDTRHGKFPFTSQYAPSGREGVSNYGKWTYARRYMFKLVRVGYWETQEQAAVEGLKAWKVRIAEIQENRNV